jgi:hypothetical protein
LVVIGEADSRSGFKPGYEHAYIGQTTPAIENNIQFLRTAQALTVLDGRPIRKQTVLQVIEECNKQVHAVFSEGIAEATVASSTIVPQSMLDQLAVRLVCEDRRLSMQRVGDSYLALDMSRQQLSPIDINMFDFMLDVSAAMLEFDLTQASPQARKLMYRIQESDGYVLARRVLRARM